MKELKSVSARQLISFAPRPDTKFLSDDTYVRRASPQRSKPLMQAVDERTPLEVAEGRRGPMPDRR